MFLRSYPPLENLEDSLRVASCWRLLKGTYFTLADCPSATGTLAQGMVTQPVVQGMTPTL